LVRPGWPNGLATVIARSGLYAALFPKSKALQMLTVTASYGPSWVNALGRIRAPALILWSRGDEGVSHTTALDVRRAIAGSTLVWLDKASGHEIPRTRPELVGTVACQLARGVSPADIGRRLGPPLLRAGESFVTPESDSSDK
jgi:pimeloyl-ACP methyl ester carboxylesterase